MSDLAAAILFFGVLLYAVSGGADFGAGVWDLLAGGDERGRRPRDLIAHALGPVWEANHVWLVYCLVVFWSAFPSAFAAVMTTLYIPLGLAALGIVIRGAGFAFRKAVEQTSHQRVYGAAFAASSVVTPFFLGAVAGAIASGRVPAEGNGDPLDSWLAPTGLLGGVLGVGLCAYLAAAYLTADARIHGESALEGYFRIRAVVAAVVAGAAAIGGLAVLRSDARHLYDRLVSGPALPVALASVICGCATLGLLWRGAARALRWLAAVTAATVVVGWGVAQYPYALGTHDRFADVAAPTATIWSLVVVFGVAAALVVPSLALLYALQTRGRLHE
jgi:cytochrome d ubiquinol oxidase subunit II